MPSTESLQWFLKLPSRGSSQLLRRSGHNTLRWLNELIWPLGLTPLNTPFDESLTLAGLLRWITYTEYKLLALGLGPALLFVGEHALDLRPGMWAAIVWLSLGELLIALVWVRSVPIYKAITDEVTANVLVCRLGIITCAGTACWFSFWLVWTLETFGDAGPGVSIIVSLVTYIGAAVACCNLPTLSEISWEVFTIFAYRNILHVEMKNWAASQDQPHPALAV